MKKNSILNDLIDKQKNHDIFINRYENNVKILSINSSKEDFWHAMIACLLTSKQDSSEGRPVQQFLKEKTFQLSLNILEKNNINQYATKILKDFGGIRNYNRIGEYIDKNFKYLNIGGWQELNNEAEKLSKLRAREPIFQDIVLERKASNYIKKNFIGFGPKQSRNFWQWLGYTRYEIPLDSRNTNWFDSNDIFSIKISNENLSSIRNYETVLDMIQDLCQNNNILPCMLDAAIFSYYE